MKVSETFYVIRNQVGSKFIRNHKYSTETKFLTSAERHETLLEANEALAVVKKLLSDNLAKFKNENPDYLEHNWLLQDVNKRMEMIEKLKVFKCERTYLMVEEAQ